MILLLPEGTTFENVKRQFLLTLSELLNCIPIVRYAKELEEETSRVARQSSNRNVA